jgi:hypothetical protein
LKLYFVEHGNTVNFHKEIVAQSFMRKEQVQQLRTHRKRSFDDGILQKMAILGAELALIA